MFLLAGGDEEGTISVVAAVRLSCAQRILFIPILKSKSWNINFSADVNKKKTGAEVIHFWTDYLPPPDSIS